jgi:hypothetical protein
MKNIILNDLDRFAGSFWISDFDHEKWYGD